MFTLLVIASFEVISVTEPVLYPAPSKSAGYSRIYPSPLFPPTNSGIIQSPFITLNLLDESLTSDCAFPVMLLSAVK